MIWNTDHPFFGWGHICHLDFPGGAILKNLPTNAGDLRVAGPVPWLGRSPGEGSGNPLQNSCLTNPMDRGAWRVWSMGLQRVGNGWSEFAHIQAHMPKGTINSTPLPSTRATDMPVSSNGTLCVHLFLGTWPQVPFSSPGNEMLPNWAVVAKQPQASYTPAFYASDSNKKQ